MTWVVPSGLEDAVYAAARGALGEAALTTSLLTRAIVERSRRYTSDRASLGRGATDPGDLAARAVFFTIADAMKIAIPIRELANRGALPAARPLRVLDVGAGCGAMTLGILATEAIPLELVALDRDAGALAIAAAAIRDFAARRGIAAAVTTRAGDVTRGAFPAADLVVLGTVLNELPPEAALALVLRAVAAIGDDGAVIVIEPALRETARALHELRDAVIARGAAHVFAPCTRTQAPCPALADPADWCHEDRALQLPPRTAELARLTHLRDGGMKFAYLVLRKQPAALAETGDAAWRIVSAPMPAKGKLELYGCSARGRIRLRLLRRHRTAANRDFERADRGDVLAIAGPADAIEDDRLELDAATAIVRTDPSRPPG